MEVRLLFYQLFTSIKKKTTNKRLKKALCNRKRKLQQQETGILLDGIDWENDFSYLGWINSQDDVQILIWLDLNLRDAEIGSFKMDNFFVWLFPCLVYVKDFCDTIILSWKTGLHPPCLLFKSPPWQIQKSP